MMHSIKAKYTAYLVIGVLLSSILIGGSSLFLMNRKIVSDTTLILNLRCHEDAEVVNDTLSSTRQSVEFMKKYIETLDYDPGGLRSDKKYLKQFEDDVLPVFRDAAENTTGAVTFYMRFVPKDFGGTMGFLYSKEYSHNYLGTGFTEMKKTDLAKYSEDDSEVSWFYTPINTAKSAWISPYWGDNLKINMISYVAPIYVDGEAVGIIGMDIDFDRIIAAISGHRLYNNSYALLVGNDGSAVHSDYSESEDSAVRAEEEVAIFAEQMTADSSDGELIYYRYDESDKVLVYEKLNNDMTLALVADSDDIFAQLRFMVCLVIIIVVLMGVLISVIGWRLIKRISTPLEQLTTAATDIANGALDVSLPEIIEEDEVGRLTEAFDKTVVHLKEYIDYVQSLAYEDALTGTRNKAAYDQVMERVDVAIRQGTAEYALLMIDLNRLKAINDTYGHENGNKYIINLCTCITEMFVPSRVFRIGGDEFVIILEDDDYRNRKEYLSILRERLHPAGDKDIDPWDDVSAAVGLGTFDPETDTGPEDVFKRADEDMYANKVAMKGNRGDERLLRDVSEFDDSITVKETDSDRSDRVGQI